ncbi:NuoI/complex I 23 kDa subunit family protein [Calderihabitans maritimus]|uniref:NADH-quinone oxidoreductase subunit I n=1 Tax=Calderihabitans maritimus TaxID=1246530 RepID=A0A1Z5HTJ0_9FIRM|nr:NADH-quinone oxidoreductase subunit I [Calderihabitans maritimus]GAW92853.1 4Fe-4S ferredoxin [Calderihabitans maritimus]
MYGQGLLKGLGITLKHLFGKAVTEQYPDQRPNLSPRFHGSFALDVEKCIACGICAKACPNNVIKIASSKGENKKRRLDDYKIELGYCLFCGLCVESCPTDAINFTQDFELASYTRQDTVLHLYNRASHETDGSGESDLACCQGTEG